MATLTNTKIKDTYDGLLKTTDNEALDASGVTLIEDGLGNASALSVGRSGNGVTVTGNLVLNGGQISLFLSDGLTQVGKFYDDSGFVVEGKVNNNLILRTKANSSGEGIKFQDSSSNDLMFIDGLNGRVGIGTSSPAQLLSVVDSSTSASPAILIGNGDSSARSALLRNQNDASFFDIIASASATAAKGIRFFSHTASEKMRIDSNGRVGIGTSSPESTLHVSTNSSVNQFILERTGTSTGKFKFLTLNNTLVIRNEALATDNLIIDSSGNVGIGTSSPSQKLDVNGNIEFLGRIAPSANTATAASPSICAGFDYDTGIFNPADNTMAFSTTGSERMRIDSSGNVGIGQTPDANSKLAVYGGRTYLDATNEFTIRISNAGAVGGFIGTPASGALGFYSTTGLERMRIDSSGRVLFGTTAEPNGTSVYGAGFSPISSDRMFLRTAASTTASSNLIGFYNPNGLVGTISSNGTSIGIGFEGGAAANTLDDYEEGTWTMGISFGGGSTGVTYSTNTGQYTKIGRMVTVKGRLQLSNKGTSTGGARITGLPFSIPNNNGYRSPATVLLVNVSFANQFQATAQVGTSEIILSEITEAGSYTDLNETDFINTSVIDVSATYFV